MSLSVGAEVRGGAWKLLDGEGGGIWNRCFSVVGEEGGRRGARPSELASFSSIAAMESGSSVWTTLVSLGGEP